MAKIATEFIDTLDARIPGEHESRGTSNEGVKLPASLTERIEKPVRRTNENRVCLNVGRDLDTGLRTSEVGNGHRQPRPSPSRSPVVVRLRLQSSFAHKSVQLLLSCTFISQIKFMKAGHQDGARSPIRGHLDNLSRHLLKKDDVSQTSLAGSDILTTYMQPIADLSRPTLHLTSPFFEDGLGTHVTQNKSFGGYANYAIQILHEYDVIPPDEDRFTLIVESALAAQTLFYAASLHPPEQVELHQVFEAFVVSCVLPPEKRSNP